MHYSLEISIQEAKSRVPLRYSEALEYFLHGVDLTPFKVVKLCLPFF